MPEEEVTRLEANLAQDETAAVRVVRVIHPALRQRAMAAQHGITPEIGELSQEVRARHGRHDQVHDGVSLRAAGHQARVQARDAAHVRRLDAPATLHISAQEPRPPPVGEGGAHKGDRGQERKERRDPPARQAEDAEVLRGPRELGIHLANDRRFWKQEEVKKAKLLERVTSFILPPPSQTRVVDSSPGERRCER